MKKILGIGLFTAASAAFAIGRYLRSEAAEKGVVSEGKFPKDKAIKTNKA